MREPVVQAAAQPSKALRQKGITTYQENMDKKQAVYNVKKNGGTAREQEEVEGSKNNAGRQRRDTIISTCQRGDVTVFCITWK
jgi:hypothetical protein